MKVFYDDQGTVVGWVNGSNPSIEQEISVVGASDTKVSEDLAAVINDPSTPTPLDSLQVVDGEVVIVDPPVEASPPTEPADPVNT